MFWVISVNQRAPSGPAAMPWGPLFDIGIEYSVKLPVVVIRPILFAKCSVNHRAPSGPETIPFQHRGHRRIRHMNHTLRLLRHRHDCDF